MYIKSSPCPFVFTLKYLPCGHLSENADFQLDDHIHFQKILNITFHNYDNPLLLEINKDVLGWPKSPYDTNKRQVSHFYQ